MDALGADPARQSHDRRAVEIAAGSFPDLVNLVGEPREQGAAIRRRKQRERA